jgi:hypothetical protein
VGDEATRSPAMRQIVEEYNRLNHWATALDESNNYSNLELKGFLNGRNGTGS